MSPRRILATSAAMLALVACGGTEPPPAAAPPALPAGPGPAGATGRPSLLEAEPTVEAPPAPASPEGPLQASPGRFAPVALPAGATAIVAVDGRGADDVWMLTATGPVLHWDG